MRLLLPVVLAAWGFLPMPQSTAEEAFDYPGCIEVARETPEEALALVGADAAALGVEAEPRYALLTVTLELLPAGPPGVVRLTGTAGLHNFPATSGAYDPYFNGGTFDAFVAESGQVCEIRGASVDGGLIELEVAAVEDHAVGGAEGEAAAVDLQAGQGHVGEGAVDAAVPLDLGEVPDPAQQAVGDARRTPRAAGDLQRAALLAGHAEDARAAPDHD